jgi:hypothetical protein
MQGTGGTQVQTCALMWFVDAEQTVALKNDGGFATQAFVASGLDLHLEAFVR